MNIQNSLYSNYSALSNGSQITSAASNPANMAISEKLESATTGLKQEINNEKSSQDLYSVTGAAYQSITDNLQRMRELSLQATNGTLTDNDKSLIQKEIAGIKESINDTIKNTEFNGIKILQGEASDSLGIKEISLDSLGLKDFDVTGNFSIKDIDNAIDSINSSRSEIGASYNSLSHSISNKENYRTNLTNSLSKIKDTNYAEEITKMKTQNILQQYQVYMQEKQMSNQELKLNLFR